MDINDKDNSIQNKQKVLLLVLAGIFITNAVIAEVIGVKIFSLEGSLGLPQARIKLLSDFVLDFNLTAGVVLWPVVFISTDIINEYFGKSGVKQISILTAVLIAYMFFVLYIIIQLIPAPFWLEINNVDDAGNPLNIDYAFNVIFSQGLGIIIGSIVAFLLGQFLDAYIFQRLKKLTGDRKIWLRATGSTLVSQLIDSFVVLFIAFYFLAPSGKQWTVSQVVSVALINYIYKFIVAVLLTPLIYLVHYLIDGYLGRENAALVKETALTKN